MRESYDRIDVRPVSGALGAEILGIDVARPLDNETVSELHDAWLDHLVLFFHDQHLTPDRHKDFARRFGELHIHPLTEGMPGHPEIVEVVKEPGEHHNWGDGWHTDLPFLEEPPMGSVLYAREVPPFSGDTQFANMYLAYETLSDAMKGVLDGLRCVFRGGVGNYDRFEGMRAISDAGDFVAAHPVVRAHPRHRQEVALPAPQERQRHRRHERRGKRGHPRLPAWPRRKPRFRVPLPVAGELGRHVGQPLRPAQGQRRLFPFRTGIPSRPQTPSPGDDEGGSAVLNPGAISSIQTRGG